jgi:hypothetical protein
MKDQFTEVFALAEDVSRAIGIIREVDILHAR